jgi:hypothetical protein
MSVPNTQQQLDKLQSLLSQGNAQQGGNPSLMGESLSGAPIMGGKHRKRHSGKHSRRHNGKHSRKHSKGGNHPLKYGGRKTRHKHKKSNKKCKK